MKFLNDGGRRFLVLPCDRNIRNSYAYKMIVASRPSKLLPITVTEDLNGLSLLYDVSGRIPLSACKDGTAAEYLPGILLALSQLSDALSDLVLNPENVLFDPACIFLRSETGEVSFVYDPTNSLPLSESLPKLTEFFLHDLQTQSESEVLLFYGLYQKSREENVTLKTLYEFRLEKMEEERRSGAGNGMGKSIESETESSATGGAEDAIENGIEGGVEDIIEGGTGGGKEDTIEGAEEDEAESGRFDPAFPDEIEDARTRRKKVNRNDSPANDVFETDEENFETDDFATADFYGCEENVKEKVNAYRETGKPVKEKVSWKTRILEVLIGAIFFGMTLYFLLT